VKPLWNCCAQFKTNIMKAITQEFRNYALKHRRISGLHVDNYLNSIQRNATLSAVTPYIIEERSLNVAQMDVFSRLMMDRVIFLGTQVDDGTANIIQAQLLFLQSTDAQRDIQLYINSPGGSVYAGLGIYDTMQYITPDVATICTGVALSFGAVLLCAGAAGKRAALPHSRVMLHQPHGGAQGQTSDMEITLREFVKLKHELNEIIARHSRQDYQKVHDVSDRDYWMTAQEAKDFGIIDEVLNGAGKEVV
jgi:ATP-dependent Clp protease, protease subunit